MAFKMKGSPMYRNYGVGSPMNQGKQSKKTSETIPETTANPNLGVPYGDRDDWIRGEDGSWLHKDKHTDDGKTLRELGRTSYVEGKKNQ